MQGESEREDDPREEDRHEENLWRFAQTLRQDADKTNPQHHIHTGTTHLACQATTPNQDRETPNGGAVFARLLPDHEVGRFGRLFLLTSDYTRLKRGGTRRKNRRDPPGETTTATESANEKASPSPGATRSTQKRRTWSARNRTNRHRDSARKRTTTKVDKIVQVVLGVRCARSTRHHPPARVRINPSLDRGVDRDMHTEGTRPCPCLEERSSGRWNVS